MSLNTKINKIKDVLLNMNELKKGTYVIKDFKEDDDFNIFSYKKINEPFTIKSIIQPNRWNNTIGYKIELCVFKIKYFIKKLLNKTYE